MQPTIVDPTMELVMPCFVRESSTQTHTRSQLKAPPTVVAASRLQTQRIFVSNLQSLKP
jgi:hypothetical protein